VRKTHPETIPLTTDVCTWPEAALSEHLLFDRFREQSGHQSIADEEQDAAQHDLNEVRFGAVFETVRRKWDADWKLTLDQQGQSGTPQERPASPCST